MKTCKFYFHTKQILIISLSSLALLFYALPGQAQHKAGITGKLADKKNQESLSYANVGLFNSSDSKLIQGIISDTGGYFRFSELQPGTYTLKVSMIGYEPLRLEIHINDDTIYVAGTMYMNQNTIQIAESIVTADRLKGKSEKDKTSYYVTRKMAESSHNGIDIVKLVPGVQVDLMRNISIDGSQQILILVDGKERDKNFVSQIVPDQIEKIEILNTPPAGYDGDVTGVMNIVMKKDRNSGINGQINLEIPVSASFYYLHPDYSISYAYKKLNFFTSYNGEIIRFDQQESVLRRIKVEDISYETRSDQFVIQKTWSHYFHYGVDYAINAKNRISFYGFYNPYSQEYDGKATASAELDNNGQWEALRNTNDMNRSIFYSLFLKHNIRENGGEITAEWSHYQMNGENHAAYFPVSEGTSAFENTSAPFQKAISLKADMSLPLQHHLAMSTGIRYRNFLMADRIFEEFRYAGEVYSAYATLGQTLKKIDWKLGFRVEKSISNLENTFRKHYLSILPSASVSFKLSADNTLKCTVSTSANRPNIYQLNPNMSTDDPYTQRRGNPSLDPEERTALSLEYSRKMKSNFGSVRFFYNRTGHAISNLITRDESSIFETQTGNFGTIHQTGLQLSGTFKAFRSVTFIPYMRCYAQFTDASPIAEANLINDRSQMVVEPGFSSLISLKHDFNVGMTFQYGSPRNNVTTKSFGDPLYMVSVDKGFKNKFKAGIVSALPFNKTFTYQGSEMHTGDLYSRYSGNIHISGPFLWFKISYQFHSGKNAETMNRTIEDVDTVPKKTGL